MQDVENWELVRVCAMGDFERARDMLRAGAEVNYVDYDGRTALHLCASEGHARVAKLLLMNGADYTKKDR